MQSIIMHIDLNSYFASVAQQDNPAFRGKPVGVCEHLGGIIIGASIEAKRWGITTGTPVWEARKIFPKIILTKTHPDRYRFYTTRFVKVVSDYTAEVEKYSIDEVFLDVTKVCNVKIRNKKSGAWDMADPFEEAIGIAKEIKQRFFLEVGDWLTCSVGIAWNKTVAKIASDMKKPDGLVVVRPENKHLLYKQLSLTDIPGIGKRQERRLNELGIRTLEDLRKYPKSHLVSIFGINGHHLFSMGQLEASFKPTIATESEIKSMGHMYTLPVEFREKKFFVPVLYKLSEMVGQRLRKEKMMGNVIHFHIHDSNYACFGKSRKLGEYIFDGREIFLQAANIFEKLNLPPTVFKLIGVTVSGLVAMANQLSLFPSVERSKRVGTTLDIINQKYGNFTISRAAQFGARQVLQDSVGFGRMKEFKSWKK
jgi:DNA polymerase-4